MLEIFFWFVAPVLVFGMIAILVKGCIMDRSIRKWLLQEICKENRRERNERKCIKEEMTEMAKKYPATKSSGFEKILEQYWSNQSKVYPDTKFKGFPRHQEQNQPCKGIKLKATAYTA